MVSFILAALAAVAPVTVEMSPCGTQTFTHVPSRIFACDANYLDIVWALGHGDDVIATGPASGFAITNYFAEIAGSMGRGRLAPAFPNCRRTSGAARLAFDKEFFYSLGTDILHLDPMMLRSSRFSAADCAEVARAAGPFFANRFSRDDSPVPGCPDYRYYTILELTEKAAEVYRETARYERIAAFTRDLEERIVARLPPPERRPRVGLVFYNAAGNSGRILPYAIGNGFGQAQYRLLGVRDAFAEAPGSGGGTCASARTYGTGGANAAGLDLEGLLAIDPDILIMPFAHVAQGAQAEAYRQLQALATHPVGRHLKAVRNRRVYDGGTPLQGPITYLFQLELAAQQIYPEIFPPQQPLFDRSALGDLFAGTAQSLPAGDEDWSVGHKRPAALRQKSVTVPLTAHAGNNMHLVSATLNGAACRLLVDTGATHTTFDLGFVTNSLPDTKLSAVQLAGKTNVRLQPHLMPVREFKVGDYWLSEDHYAMVLPLAHLTESVGERVDGILGMSDLGGEALIFRDGELVFSPDDGQLGDFGPALGLAFENNRPRVPVTLNGQTLSILLDTGSSWTFLNRDLWSATSNTVSLTATEVNGSRPIRPVLGRRGTLDFGVPVPVTPRLIGTGANLLGADLLKGADIYLKADANVIRFRSK